MTVLSLAMASVMVGTSYSLAAATATESVQSTIDEVIRVLQDTNLKAPDRAEERRRELEKVIGNRFSYDEMAKRSLGAQWAKLNEKQRQEFVALFQRMLSHAYAGKIEGYSGEQIKYLNERLKDGYAEVRTKVLSGKAEIPLDYRLLSKSGEWRVYDVIVDGISLVNNYRGQFAKIIRSSSYEDLVEKLRLKSDNVSAPKEEKSK
ncbi:MAG: MlaC/ttg2D family ABC transporter substrate-binding protein [Nitrospiraceae bacterium]